VRAASTCCELEQGISANVALSEYGFQRQRRSATLRIAPWWWVEGAAVDFARRSTNMIIIGIILAFVGLAYLCWLLFALTVHALSFFALCGRPHKANYVASHHMWRTGRSMLILRRTADSYATY
jgi:hypothetical protein